MKASSFSLQNQDGSTVTLDSLKGKKVLLYFYPKADTPGCTLQACGMRDNIDAIHASGYAVIGISPDEVRDLKKFQQKYSLNYELLADPTTSVCQAYGVWQQKQFMGRTYMGVVRTSFLIDVNGEIIKKYEKVTPETHAELILNDIHGTKTNPQGKVVVKSLDQPKKAAKKVTKKKASVKKTAKKKAAKKKGTKKKAIKKK